MKKAIITVKYPIFNSDTFTVKTHDDGDLVIVTIAKVDCVIAIEEANSKLAQSLKSILKDIIDIMYIPISNISSIIIKK